MSAAIISVDAPNFAGLPVPVGFVNSLGDTTGQTGQNIPVFAPGFLYPAPPTPLPNVILAGDTYVSGPIPQLGLRSVAVSLQADQIGIMTLSRFIDPAGLVKITADVEQPLSAGILGTIVLNDGVPFGSFILTVNIPGSTTANITNAYILQGS